MVLRIRIIPVASLIIEVNRNLSGPTKSFSLSIEGNWMLTGPHRLRELDLSEFPKREPRHRLVSPIFEAQLGHLDRHPNTSS